MLKATALRQFHKGGERSAPSQQTSFLKMMQKGRVVQLKEEEKRAE